MIVIDASALVEYLLGSPAGLQVRGWLHGRDHAAAVPHLCIAETAAVMRSLVRAGKLEAARATGLLDDLASLPVVRYAHEPLLPRAWQLRENLTIYDAIYVALAEQIDGTLLTCDARLARAPSTGISIELISF